MNIRYMNTNYVYPPIPIRTCDWFAGWDDQEGHGEHGRTEQEAVQNLLDNTDEVMTPVVFSYLWTGRGHTLHWNFWSKTQLPFFMVYELYYDDRGEVVHGKVLFNSMDITRWFKSIWGNYVWASFE